MPRQSIEAARAERGEVDRAGCRGVIVLGHLRRGGGRGGSGCRDSIKKQDGVSGWALVLVEGLW